jgi:hypothetical protein
MHLLYLAANLVVLLATSAWCISIPEKRASVCNGHAELCDRSYGNITYVGGELHYDFLFLFLFLFLHLIREAELEKIQHMIRLRIAQILSLVRSIRVFRFLTAQ